MDEERLEDLLLRWEELAEAGQVVSAAELCRDCPELSAELERRIEALKRVAWLTQTSGEPKPSSPSFTSLAPGSEPIPGYRLVQQLGKGGFSEVWKAEGPNGPVALKFLQQTAKAAQGEQRSLRIIRHIEHPNLLRTYDSWQVDGLFIVAMELADRSMMDRWQQVRSEGSAGIAREELLRYLHEAAEALDYLQRRSLQHRDIKPQNLFLMGGTLKVGDFGLARLLVHSITGHTGSLTVSYAAPEFFEGRTTRQSDQYSLAVTYCQMRGGKLPFEGSPAALVAAHLHRSPDLSMLPPEERPAVEKALAKRPADRWPSCRAFIEALANPALTPRRRRRRMLPWLAATLLALAVVVTFVLLRGRTPPVAEMPSPFRSFEVPPLPSRSQNLIRNVVVGRMGEPFNKCVALTNGAGAPTLWDVATGKIIRRLPVKAGPGIALAPFEEPLGLTGGDDGNVILWNLHEEREVLRFQGHSSSVSSVAFSRDGSKVLTGSCDKTVRLFDRATGKEIHCLRGHQSLVMSVAFGPRGRHALSGGWDGTVRIWNLESGKEVRCCEGNLGQVWCVAYSDDGRWGLSGGQDRIIRLWDLNKGKLVRRFEGHTGQIGSVAFHNSDRIIVSAGDYTVRLWSANNGRELCRSPETPSEVKCGALLELDGVHHVLIGTEKDGLLLWRLSQDISSL
jgi:serine/threonine protein kinase